MSRSIKSLGRSVVASSSAALGGARAQNAVPPPVMAAIWSTLQSSGLLLDGLGRQRLQVPAGFGLRVETSPRTTTLIEDFVASGHPWAPSVAAALSAERKAQLEKRKTVKTHMKHEDAGAKLLKHT